MPVKPEALPKRSKKPKEEKPDTTNLDFGVPSPFDCALYYAFLGWRVIPNHALINGKCSCAKKNECPSAGKHPRIADWTDQASTDYDQIKLWFNNYWPRSNIGVVTGKDSGIFVVDIDAKKGGIEKWGELIKQHGDLPNTPIANTGSGGAHVYLKWPDHVVVPTRATLFEGVGIDLRGEGGQAVLPPSENAGGAYAWCESFEPWNVDPAPAPDWLLALISAASLHGTETERVNVIRALCGVAEGERNQAIYRLACSLRGQDYSLETAIMWVTQAAENCDPPYPIREALDAVNRAYQKYPAGGWKNVRPPYSPPIETREWQEPVGFDEAHLPPFPTHVLPGWVKNYVEAVAESTQTPADMSGLVSLSVLATTVARKIRVQVYSDWSEPLNLYTVTCARPGSRKSAVFEFMNDPIKEHEKIIKAQKKNDVTKCLTKIDMLEADMKVARIKAAKNPDQRDAVADEIVLKTAEIEALKKMAILPDITADDITPETIKSKLYEQNGRLAILSAEGDVFGMMNGRYQANGEANIDVYIKGHPGDDIKVNRMSGRAEEISHPALTIGICTQKKSLRGLLTKTALNNRGLYARFLYSMKPEMTDIEEDLSPRPIPVQVKQIYRTNVRRMLEKMTYRVEIPPDGQSEAVESAHVITLSPEAVSLLNEFRKNVTRECRSGMLSTTDELSEWGAKLAGAVVRIAGLLHLAENVMEDRPWEWEINGTTMGAACEIGRYLMPHAVVAHTQMASTPAYDVARQILLYLQRHDKKTKITKQDAVRCTKKNGQLLDTALMLLMDHGFIREEYPGKRGTSFEVNTIWDKQKGTEEIE